MESMTLDDVTEDEMRLQEWVGKTAHITSKVDADHANKLAGTLDDETVYKEGDRLPAAWHWAWFQPGSLQSKLGRDGHPATGSFMPPVGLPRRMWAGSDLIFDSPILLGETITKTSVIEEIKMKSGTSGSLCFVTVRHDYSGPKSDHRFTDRQTLVYRNDPSPNTPAPKPVVPPNGDLVRTIDPTTTLLFRYSALTFNTHRIHYDRDYCISVEGYPGLLVHGPLQATLLAGTAERFGKNRPIKRLTFRARAPLYDTASFAIFAGEDDTFWSLTPEGGIAMSVAVGYSD